MNPVEMSGQFLLAKAESPVLAGWPKRQLGQWILHQHPHLPVSDVRSQDGTQMAWIIGLAVDAEGRVLPPVWHLPFDCEAADSAIRFEAELDRLAGRFAAVFLTPRIQRFYLDASGSLAAVYCQERQAVASSCNLIPQIAGLQKNFDLIKSLGIPFCDSYFPFGLTPWSAITRLLPNHFLDISNWTAQRHWPKGNWTDSVEPLEKMVEQIAALTEAYIRGVANLAPLQVPLTAGYDSRMLLACLGSSLPDIRFYTDAIPDFTARVDCAYGRRIAKRFGLKHSVRTWQDSTREEIENWLNRTGACVTDRITRSTRTDRQSDPTRITVLAVGGEACRRPYWEPSDRTARHLSTDGLLERFDFPVVDAMVREASDWLNGLPAANVVQILDLFYLEQRLGCWAGPSMYGPVGPRFLAYGFNSRQIYEKMLSLPLDYRSEERLPIDLIRLKWPELLEFPFNEPLGLLKLERQARRCLAVAKRMTGKLGAGGIKPVPVAAAHHSA